MLCVFFCAWLLTQHDVSEIYLCNGHTFSAFFFFFSILLHDCNSLSIWAMTKSAARNILCADIFGGI